jgi:hypothetical protein
VHISPLRRVDVAVTNLSPYYARKAEWIGGAYRDHTRIHCRSFAFQVERALSTIGR